jgi:hypothetical protein
MELCFFLSSYVDSQKAAFNSAVAHTDVILWVHRKTMTKLLVQECGLCEHQNIVFLTSFGENIKGKTQRNKHTLHCWSSPKQDTSYDCSCFIWWPSVCFARIPSEMWDMFKKPLRAFSVTSGNFPLSYHFASYDSVKDFKVWSHRTRVGILLVALSTIWHLSLLEMIVYGASRMDKR